MNLYNHSYSDIYIVIDPLQLPFAMEHRHLQLKSYMISSINLHNRRTCMHLKVLYYPYYDSQYQQFYSIPSNSMKTYTTSCVLHGLACLYKTKN